MSSRNLLKQSNSKPICNYSFQLITDSDDRHTSNVQKEYRRTQMRPMGPKEFVGFRRR